MIDRSWRSYDGIRSKAPAPNNVANDHAQIRARFARPGRSEPSCPPKPH